MSASGAALAAAAAAGCFVLHSMAKMSAAPLQQPKSHPCFWCCTTQALYRRCYYTGSSSSNIRLLSAALLPPLPSSASPTAPPFPQCCCHSRHRLQPAVYCCCCCISMRLHCCHPRPPLPLQLHRPVPGLHGKLPLNSAGTQKLGQLQTYTAATVSAAGTLVNLISSSDACSPTPSPRKSALLPSVTHIPDLRDWGVPSDKKYQEK